METAPRDDEHGQDRPRPIPDPGPAAQVPAGSPFPDFAERDGTGHAPPAGVSRSSPVEGVLFVVVLVGIGGGAFFVLALDLGPVFIGLVLLVAIPMVRAGLRWLRGRGR